MIGACGIFEARFLCNMQPTGGPRWRQILENHMRTGALLLALAFMVAAATTADAAKKKRTAAPADPTAQSQQNTMNLLGDLMHPWAPSNQEKMAKPAKKKKKKPA